MKGNHYLLIGGIAQHYTWTCRIRFIKVHLKLLMFYLDQLISSLLMYVTPKLLFLKDTLKYIIQAQDLVTTTVLSQPPTPSEISSGFRLGGNYEVII